MKTITPEEFLDELANLPSFQRTGKDFDDEDEKAFKKGLERPFNGQPHTFCGVRGSTVIERVRVRDIGDAVATILHRYEERTHTNLDMDTEATAQEVCLLVEKMMGTYPNLPE